jgi:hypothetical protein
MDYMHGAVLYQFICLCAGALLLAQSTTNFKKEDSYIILNAMAITAILQSCWVFAEYLFGLTYSDIFNFFGGEYATVTHEGRHILKEDRVISGSLANSNYSGALLAICSIALLRRGWRWVLSFTIAALFMLGATLPAISFLFGACVSIALNMQVKGSALVKIMTVIAAILVVITLTSSRTSVFRSNSRVTAWNATIKNIFIGKSVKVEIDQDKKESVTIGRRYIAGHGLGYFPSVSAAFMPESVTRSGRVWRQAHNEYLEFIYIFGLIGVLYLYLLFRPLSLLRFPDPYIVGAFAVTIFNSSGHFLFHISSTAFIGIILLGLLYNQTGRENI